MLSELGPLHKPYGCVVGVFVRPLTAGAEGATDHWGPLPIGGSIQP